MEKLRKNGKGKEENKEKLKDENEKCKGKRTEKKSYLFFIYFLKLLGNH